MAKVKKKDLKTAGKKVEQKRYRLTEQHYRHGRLYEAGETLRIPVTEVPGRSWVEIDDDGDDLVEIDEGALEEPQAEADESEKPKKAKAGKAPKKEEAEADESPSDTDKSI